MLIPVGTKLSSLLPPNVVQRYLTFASKNSKRSRLHYVFCLVINGSAKTEYLLQFSHSKLFSNWDAIGLNLKAWT